MKPGGTRKVRSGVERPVREHIIAEVRYMRFSLCSVGNKEEAVEAIIPKAAALGYEGIELWSGHTERYEEKHGELQSLCALLERHSLQATVIAGYS